MTRLCNAVANSYPRQRIWWMECDACRITISAPAWSEHDLPLDRFTAEGWRCRPEGAPLDTCPTCLTREKDTP